MAAIALIMYKFRVSNARTYISEEQLMLAVSRKCETAIVKSIKDIKHAFCELR